MARMWVFGSSNAENSPLKLASVYTSASSGQAGQVPWDLGGGREGPAWGPATPLQGKTLGVHSSPVVAPWLDPFLPLCPSFLSTPPQGYFCSFAVNLKLVQKVKKENFHEAQMVAADPGDHSVSEQLQKGAKDTTGSGREGPSCQGRARVRAGGGPQKGRGFSPAWASARGGAWQEEEV